MPIPLSITDHRRDSAGLTYVYPVVSRRAGGISVGINLNPNHACNWRCLYCQVPALRRGAAPPLDHRRLKEELQGMLASILRGDFHQRFQVPLPYRRLRDIAISGDGEPTTLKDFATAVATIGEAVAALDPPPDLAKVLISNGSLVQRREVRQGLRRWGEMGGVVWFKLDRATSTGLRRVNGAAITPARVLTNLETTATLCPVWIQTCLFALDGQPPPEEEQRAWLDFLRTALNRPIPIEGVLIYGLARPSMQPQTHRLAPLPAPWLEEFAGRVRELGISVQATP